MANAQRNQLLLRDALSFDKEMSLVELQEQLNKLHPGLKIDIKGASFSILENGDLELEFPEGKVVKSVIFNKESLDTGIVTYTAIIKGSNGGPDIRGLGYLEDKNFADFLKRSWAKIEAGELLKEKPAEKEAVETPENPVNPLELKLENAGKKLQELGGRD